MRRAYDFELAERACAVPRRTSSAPRAARAHAFPCAEASLRCGGREAIRRPATPVGKRVIACTE